MSLLLLSSLFVQALIGAGWLAPDASSAYPDLYRTSMARFESQQDSLLRVIAVSDLSSARDRKAVKQAIGSTRTGLKAVDFWLRYLDPVRYHLVNGPVAVEWENEVFDKYERPHRREGAGLTLAEQFVDGTSTHRDSLALLIRSSLAATTACGTDANIIHQLERPEPFFLANRLFLLNLATIYTTSFECPEPRNVVPELRSMLAAVDRIYDAFEASFPAAPLSATYRERFARMKAFADAQPDDYTAFDHFAFIRDYVNPLFALNQEMIRRYGVVSGSLYDFALNDTCNSIFDKSLYLTQDPKGILSFIRDPRLLDEVGAVGKLLFYDPILSENGARSCASCHRPNQYFADTTARTALAYDRLHRLPRNTPTLIDVGFNHLVMLDGKRLTLQDQAMAVIANPIELGGSDSGAVARVLTCSEYRRVFEKLLKLTPGSSRVTIDHVVASITYYYSRFSAHASAFDDAMDGGSALSPGARHGFNLFMSKAQCATCHYVPQFSGVRPPYVGTEFEVLGVPEDSSYRALSADPGRYDVNPAPEVMRAFRTLTVRNTEHTRPYMHNGVFATLDQVLEFYDLGGGAGHGLAIDNQTLKVDSLKLTRAEKEDLKAFIHTLNERVALDDPPAALPKSSLKMWNRRKVGGDY
jgi:cytochrome c peroxidase